MFFEPIVASVAVALLSLTGVFIFGKRGYLTGTHRFILPVAIGVFLGVIFFELIPETLEASHEWGPVAILAGFLGFYLLSFVLDTFHHHHHNDADMCATGGAKRLLIGDGVHNFADGIVIASAFMIDPTVGVITTIGIALHEIPQEIAEFGVLIHAGCTRKRAALYNLLSASTVVLGTVATVLFAEFLTPYIFILTGIAAGNLLYIATADLIPELRDTHKGHFSHTFIATLMGVIVIAGLITYVHELTGHEEDVHTETERMHE
jgi:zinc and cadmium transporter